eukprot:GILI01021881.1.p1 GENE.GILI01021881.1~~GILI01021881.1.p1  ORF type:complete len:363 (+),score=56.48 GILI01021881.1:237-1325(+)
MSHFPIVAPPTNSISRYTAFSIKTAEERREAVIKNEKILEAIDRRITTRGPEPPVSEMGMAKEPASAVDLAPLLLQACDEGDTELIDGLLYKGADPNCIVDSSMYQTEGGDLSGRGGRRRSLSNSTSIVVISADPQEQSTIAGASNSNSNLGPHLKVPPNNFFKQNQSPQSQSPKSRSNTNSHSGSRSSSPLGDPLRDHTDTNAPPPPALGGRRGSSSFSSAIFPISSVKPQKADNIPLQRACYSGRTAAVISLLEAGADANKTLSTTGDITPLRIAVAKGIPLMIESLVSIGRAAVNAPNSVGRSPLHFACEMGCPNTCEALLKVGANPMMRDNFGNTPEQLVASECSKGDAIKAILRGAR